MNSIASTIHDRRRVLHNGLGTFARVAAGIDALLAANIPVNLRVVVDRENLPALPVLARLAAERGWPDRPESAFKTQIGRNYELFGCASRQGREQLFDRLELWTDSRRWTGHGIIAWLGDGRGHAPFDHRDLHSVVHDQA
jgi:MoaA/NifB/PqqE/SkfB family radical SAM enzyme